MERVLGRGFRRKKGRGTVDDSGGGGGGGVETSGNVARRILNSYFSLMSVYPDCLALTTGYQHPYSPPHHHQLHR